DDGVTVRLPLAALPSVDADWFEWHVPGHRLELVTELIRSLPRAIRRNFVSAHEYAERFLAAHGPDDGRLDETLRAFLSNAGGEPVPIGAFDWSQLPAHLRMRFRIGDATGRDLRTLQHRLREPLRRAV